MERPSNLLVEGVRAATPLSSDLAVTDGFFNTFYGQIVLNTATLVGTIVLLLVVLYISRAIMFIGKRNSFLLDELLVKSFRPPVIILVFFIGIYSILHNLTFFFISYSLPYLNSLLPPLILLTLFWMLWRLIGALEQAAIVERRSVLPKTINTKVQLTVHTMKTMVMVSRVSLLVVICLSLLNILGVSIAGLLAFGGLGGIVLGFALKDPLSNLFAGALIFSERSFIVGDWIRCPSLGIEGVVESINWRTTLVRTFDKRPLYVPNATFINNHVENAQRMTNRRIFERIGIKYDDLDKLPALLSDIRAMMKQHQGIDDRQTLVVSFDSYGAYSLDFLVCGITYATTWAEFQAVKEDVLLQIAALVKKHGADFAYPTSVINVQQAGSEQAGAAAATPFSPAGAAGAAAAVPPFPAAGDGVGSPAAGGSAPASGTGAAAGSPASSLLHGD